jgi:tetratricopeptide (TPR) repeat protein
MNLGELAQAEAPSLAAYRLVHEVEREFKRAAELDDAIDFAGPARTLGLLYFQAPGWPLSVGNKHKARQWLERAVTLSPEFPENQLNLAEAYLKWRQKDEAAKVLLKTEAIWLAAKTNFTGAAHARDWRDWEDRRQNLRAEFQKTYKSQP